MAICRWHDFCQARSLLSTGKSLPPDLIDTLSLRLLDTWRPMSKNINLRVFRELAEPEDFRPAAAVGTETVDPDAVFLRRDQTLDPETQPLHLIGFQKALEDGVLHPCSEILQRMGQLRPSAVVRNVVGDHDQHGHRKAW